MSLIREGEVELFDYGISQDFSRDPLDLSLRLFAVQSAIQRDLEVLALPHAL